jgi:hypothetical protein
VIAGPGVARSRAGGERPLEQRDRRVREPRAESAGEPSRLRLPGLGEDRDELIATVAPHGVAAPHPVSQHLADPPEHVIAAQVAVAVVDELEIVEIDKADGQMQTPPRALRLISRSSSRIVAW